MVPFAPGTAGTLVGMPIAFLVAGWNLPLRIAFWIAISLFGAWACTIFDETMDTRDNQRLVIDEVVGVAITAWTAGTSIATWIAAFVLFRAFDILKPPPVRQVDRWSHDQPASTSALAGRWRGGLGVMADDIVAGFQGLLVILALQWLGILI